MKIRRANVSDVEILANVHTDSWRSAYRGLVPETYLANLDCDRLAECFRKNLSSNSEEMFLAEQGTGIIGFLGIGGCRDLDCGQGLTGEIYGIYLHPGYWRKGIGRLLCQKGLRVLESQGYSSVVLWVLEGNQRARGFYEAMGFVTDGSTKILNLGSQLTVVRYQKPLGSSEPGH
ncbi:N-acetyltransferase [Syntrophotalea carbinolica DSM 2380]|uniref:N-acetyltransferase n=1 Tax=Syntrophotalea carbinolica (strain DSM 2380 / NBRC 103641 / GraBd1) TaxID=338963 RepID=Q3A4S4_SYNC1|nr:GNAT family N-acetyltransferase [Syntrophotalea carbinolica]ABA88633.1 N-acetyltransferase [Syntrophotalea carbinolica DSM 2380]